MKLNSLLAIGLSGLFVACITSLRAQNTNVLKLKTSTVHLEHNIENFIVAHDYQASEVVNNSYYRIVQFSKIPTANEKKELTEKGISLLNYLPDNAFYAAIDIQADLKSLVLKNASSVSLVLPEYKLNKVLKKGEYPQWAMVGKNTIEINGSYFSDISEETVLSKLRALGAEVVASNQSNYVRFRVKISDLEKVYAQPEFYYFEEKDMPGEPEGTRDVTNHRSNTLATEYMGGLKFDGTGITVMLQDNSRLDEHIDYSGRFTNQNATQTGDHGEHCGGIIAAAGNLDPKAKGMANGAEVLVYDPSNTNYNFVPGLITSNDLTITSKSYGNGTNAGYTALARQLDQQVRNAPQLIHVFSAGNSGSGWSTITGGHKQGKNVLAVGNLTSVDNIAGSSSRGPALDGRVKPDICAVGTSVYSTIDPNNYGNKTGTSMACPGVAGVLAQLYHAYKTANGGANPDAALMKAAVLNTGDDLGNDGPDFIYGWGRVNARRAYDLIDNNYYISAAVSQGGNNAHDINVPAGVSQIRIMVHWSDYEGAASAAPALVNNIDMHVVDPLAASYDPWVLNPTNPGANAVRGVDNLNNMEQVTIDNPVAGTYTVHVDGTAIPQGPQNYYLVYEFIQDEVVLTYPIGNEGFAPSDLEIIRWDSYGNTGTFDLDYSTDNGASWNSISTNIGASLRYFPWTVPNTVSGEVLVRLTRGALTSTSDAVFSIIPTPTNLSVDWACVDSIQLSWNPVAGATGYEVSQLGIKYMDSVGTTSNTSIVLHGISSTATDWFSVRSLGPNNARGERAFAIEKLPGTFSCPINIDASISNVSPVDNGSFQSCASPVINVSMTLTNEGLDPLTNIPVHYIANGAAVVNEIYTGTIAPGANANYTFTNQLTPTTGLNSISVWADITGDGNNTNDSTFSQFNYISATAQSIPWSDNFESFFSCPTTSNCEVTICNLGNGFINETNGSADDIDWRTDAGGTPSFGTGPSQDYNPGITGGKYLYLEASGGCEGEEAQLISPCIDLVQVANPELVFAYHMNGADMGSLHVDVLANGVWNNDVMPVLSGSQGNSWQTRTVALDAFIGSVVNIRFRGITGNDYASDMAIDDIQVTGTSTVDIAEFTDNPNFRIYPNPSNGIYNYYFLSDQPSLIEVYDVNGKLVYQKSIIPGNASGNIDISNYNNGIYMLLLTKGTERITKRIIKK